MTTTTLPAPVPAVDLDGDLAAVADHDAWMGHARTAYRRLVDDIAALGPDDWAQPTPCEGWTVRDLVGHLLGAYRAAASLRENASLMAAAKRRARRTGEQEVDAMTAVQLERTASLGPDELVAELDRLVEPAVAGRRRLPGWLRRRVGFAVAMGDIDERWTLDFFTGCILTRDAWLHRVDLADATGRPFVPDAHDRAVVGDVAVEWMARHGRPCTLVLSGPAGGTLVQGAGGPTVACDALEFARIVSGRADPTHELLATAVPF